VAFRERDPQRFAFDTILQFVTLLYVAQSITLSPVFQTLKGVVIGGQTYYEATKILRVLRISRQTLWLWRKDQLIPVGSRHRNRLVFSKNETAQIVAHAARLEPVELSDTKAQMKLRLA